MPLSKPNIQSITDVYDLASVIGKEFEILIDQHGPESLSGLMPKVISALENLELLTSRAEAAADEAVLLQQRIDKLELERAARLTDRGRFEREMEQADQEWRRELQRLREENSSLKQALSEARRGNSSSASEQSAGSATSSPVQHRQQQQHLLIVARLKSALNAQRDETRILRRELANSRADCEALQAQSDRLASLNADLMKRLSKSVRRGGGGGVGDLEDKFCDDRSDSDSSDCQPELHRGDADMVTSSIEEDPSNSTPLSGFEVISSSSFYQALPSAPLLGGEPGVGLTSQASPAPARHDCRASGAEKNDGGGSNGDASNQKSNSSDLGIKYLIVRLICHLRRRLRRRRSWA
uniref:RH1 domain-containing protein n=1 Tax=Macrostomum lignano TaxID=282301 RepID=A0A1I8HYA8_9PLAT